MNAFTVKNKKQQATMGHKKEPGIAPKKSSCPQVEMGKGHDAHKEMAKLKKTRVTQCNCICEAAHGAPIPAPRTLTKWISECRRHTTFKDHQMQAQASDTSNCFPTRTFGDKEIDDVNLQTFCNFNLVSKNCL